MASVCSRLKVTSHVGRAPIPARHRRWHRLLYQPHRRGCAHLDGQEPAPDASPRPGQALSSRPQQIVGTHDKVGPGLCPFPAPILTPPQGSSRLRPSGDLLHPFPEPWGEPVTGSTGGPFLQARTLSPRPWGHGERNCKDAEGAEAEHGEGRKWKRRGNECCWPGEPSVAVWLRDMGLQVQAVLLERRCGRRISAGRRTRPCPLSVLAGRATISRRPGRGTVLRALSFFGSQRRGPCRIRALGRPRVDRRLGRQPCVRSGPWYANAGKLQLGPGFLLAHSLRGPFCGSALCTPCFRGSSEQAIHGRRAARIGDAVAGVVAPAVAVEVDCRRARGLLLGCLHLWCIHSVLADEALPTGPGWEEFAAGARVSVARPTWPVGLFMDFGESWPA